MKLDENQKKVVDMVEHGVGNAIVTAMAGSGKTSTIVEAVKAIPRNKTVLLVAFNRSIVKNLKEKFQGMRKVFIYTYHSLGYKLLETWKNGEPLKIDNFKYDKYISIHLGELTEGKSFSMSEKDKEKYKKNLKSICDFARYNMAQCEREIIKAIEPHRIEPIWNEVEACVKLLEWGQNFTDVVDYTDLTWLPCELNLNNFPMMKFDWVFIDEAQDTSPCQQTLFRSCMKSNSRCVMVGDENQCINEWCGSDKEAFKSLGNIPNTERYTLPVSYRCSKSVVRSAQRIVPEIQYQENAIEGRSEITVNIKDIKEGDMVLCRNAEPLFRLYLILQKMGKKSYILGKNMASEIGWKMNESGMKNLSRDLKTDGVFPKLYYNLFVEAETFAKKNGLDPDDVMLDSKYRDMFDGIKSMEILSEGANTVEEFNEIVNNIFIDEEGEGTDTRILDPTKYIMLSTIHKAKGLEAKNVYEACPSMCPSPMAETEREMLAEKNLEYVAITRAKDTFGYIDERELRPSVAWLSSMETRREIERVKNAVTLIYGPINADNVKINEEKYVKSVKSEEDNGKKKNKVKFKKFIW